MIFPQRRWRGSGESSHDGGETATSDEEAPGAASGAVEITGWAGAFGALFFFALMDARDRGKIWVRCKDGDKGDGERAEARS